MNRILYSAKSVSNFFSKLNFPPISFSIKSTGATSLKYIREDLRNNKDLLCPRTGQYIRFAYTYKSLHSYHPYTPTLSFSILTHPTSAPLTIKIHRSQVHCVIYNLSILGITVFSHKCENVQESIAT